MSYPDVMQLTTITKMKKHPDYKNAKSGDVSSSYRLVRDLLSGKNQIQKINYIAENFQNAILLGVYASEQMGKNKIPHALVAIIGEMTGLETEARIVQSNEVGHTGSDAIHRLAYRAKFTGDVKQGRNYILTDDVITSGSTLSELRCYIEDNGGRVVLFLTAGAAQFSTNIKLSDETRFKLIDKYGILEIQKLLKELDIYGGAFEFLTESEGRTLLGAGTTIDTARNRIIEARISGRYK
ncbi:MAG: hypothetical protein FWC47_06940 [Oscillospiraceae bacterium]|nr:hypothetical protein [Oscillospiraceae bacterium]